MDDIRESFSKLKKGIKHRLSWSKPKAGKTQTDGHGERVDSSSSLLQPPSHVVAGGDREREGGESNAGDESVGPSAAADENKSDWKSTASAAKLILRAVCDSADAFGPLKSIAGGLCFILDNCERTRANKQAIELLAPRIEALTERLCQPVLEGDIRERQRRKILERKLQDVRRDLTPLEAQGKVEGFFNNPKNADKLGGLVEDIRDAMMEYQTSLQQDIYDNVADIRQNMLKTREAADGQNQATQISSPGESPPPPPTACFGRDELIKEIIGFAENLTPMGLIGAGGIGKTSIALTVLHHDRVKQRFGDNRRFIRCDQFPATLPHLLNRLSKVIGAGVENPEDLTPLYPFLSSREILIVLDNAESILDPRGTDAMRIYASVGELSRLEKICLCITSRISTIPPKCEIIDVPTLSTNAARDAFYQIYKKREQLNAINNILEQLDFHPLSITLLATVAHQNGWSTDRLVREWEKQRIGVLQTEHNESLAATIELSLASPMFRGLGPDARELLGVIAFFPQGVDENNLDWLFPAISNGSNFFDKFCILSLTYRNNGFVTMLAPLRDYLRPKNPMSSPLLNATKECYFTRLSTAIHPDEPSFQEARWIVSEDVNVEHLLDVFTSIDANSEHVWDACAGFVEHLHNHKPRLIILGPKIEALPDDDPSKPRCLEALSQLFNSIGNQVEQKRLLTHTLKLWRKWDNDFEVAATLSFLSDANRQMGLYKEGIQQAEEASEIAGRLGDAVNQAKCLIDLAWLMFDDKQLDAAEKAASRALDLLPEGPQSSICNTHRVLGNIYRSKGETEKAIYHFKLALGIASSLNWDDGLFWVYYELAELFSEQGRLDDARAHIEHAKSHAVDDPYNLGRAMELQADFWYDQHMFEEAKLEALRAVGSYEKIGATKELEDCRRLLRKIDGLDSDVQRTK